MARAKVAMHMPTIPLLEHHRIFHSRDIEETRTFLRGKDYQFDVAPREARQLDTRLNGMYTPGMYIGYVQYGNLSVEFSPSPSRTDYWIQLPVCGQVEALVGNHTVACNPRLGAIASPAHERCRFISNAGNARIQLALNQGALIGQLAALLGDAPRAPLEFAPALDLRTGYGQSLAWYVLMAVLDLDQPGSLLLNPSVMSMFEQLITTGLLLAHPHNYSNALQCRERSVGPRDVKRAIDYLQAHLDAPVTLVNLVEASGTPGRTLFRHFRDSKGISPMRYLRNARFQQVRRALMAAQPGETVTMIAMNCGFGHMGRFSVEYRQRFGESPSETLRQGRRIYCKPRQKS